MQSIASKAKLLTQGSSVDDEDIDEDNPIPPNFSCLDLPGQYHLHTYANVSTLLYNLGTAAMVTITQPRGSLMSLSALAATRWHALNKSEVKKSLPTLKIRLPARS